MTDEIHWTIVDRITEIRSKWLTIIAERVKDDQDRLLDYWRVEKNDSVVVITLQNGKFLLPQPSYRHGVQKITLDFAGGRNFPGQEMTTTVTQIIKREFRFKDSLIVHLSAINPEGSLINSSFSNQKLFGFVADIHPTVKIESNSIGATFPVTPQGFKSLLKQLSCLQCRALLLDWWVQSFG